ncbi:MAG: TetR/AcrR family transcriptional regulator [Chlorobi bacterium]|nr:TetR/AcrR family transcriptional regulator [Chlorobiota bacterium]
MERKPTDIRQEEIKSAVLSIIFRDGLKKITTRNIAREVGLSEGSIFRHFNSKKDIILSIMDNVINDLIESLREISLKDSPPADRLHDYLCKTVNYLIENKGITILLFSEASYENDPEMISKLNYIFHSQRQLAGKIVSDGIALGIWNESISVEDFSTLFMGIPTTLNIEMILNLDKFEHVNFCKRMFDLVLKILEKQ